MSKACISDKVSLGVEESSCANERIAIKSLCADYVALAPVIVLMAYEARSTLQQRFKARDFSLAWKPSITAPWRRWLVA